MPPLKKPIPKSKAKSPPAILKPIPVKVVVNPRHEPLRNFVTEDEYVKIKQACGTLISMLKTVTLRKVWAVVDHLVEVNAGRESEVSYAARPQTQTSIGTDSKPGNPIPKRQVR